MADPSGTIGQRLVEITHADPPDIRPLAGRRRCGRRPLVGHRPDQRAVWWAEVTPIFIVYGALLVTARWFRFSNLAYALMSGWMLLHLVGAHYTFANVPFEWGDRLLSPLLGESRNHFA